MHDLFHFDPPDIDAATIAAIAADHWDVTGRQRRLDGERSHNTRLTISDSCERHDDRADRDDHADHDVVLQVQSASERPDVIGFQTEVLQFLADDVPDLPLPRVVPTVTGAPLAQVDVDGQVHLARLVTFLPGSTFDGDAPLAAPTYRSIGDAMGRMAASLATFRHPAASHFMPWDLANGLIVDAEMIADASDLTRSAVHSVSDRLVALAVAIESLPRQVVHNDGHGGNLLHPEGQPDQLVGVIDFGDVVHTIRAADVAIVAESFAPAHPDPAAVVAALTSGYHRHSPLTDAEIEAVPELVLGRIVLGMLLVDHRSREQPDPSGGAGSALRWLAERLERWRHLDTDAMVHRIHAGLETGS